MQFQDRYAILRPVLKKLGLAPDAVEDIIDRVNFFLGDKIQNPFEPMQYPYAIRDDFQAPAEQNLYQALKSILPPGVVVLPKVALGELFVARPSDPAKVRFYTNKMDRKRVDLLLCDARTLRPIAGIQLEEQSLLHSRDEFLINAFLAAKLPLVWIMAKPSYTAAELTSLLQPYLQGNSRPASRPVPQPAPQSRPQPTPQPTPRPSPPPEPNPAADYPRRTLRCPKCGSEMILRTALSGDNQVDQFWGCSRYPQCNGKLKYDPMKDFS
jgi:hypothetical protein